MKTTIRPCRAEDLDAVSDMLARSFEVDAAYRYLFPDERTRTEGLRRFFARNLGLHLPYRCTHLMENDGEGVLATVTLRPPGGIHISTLTMIRRGLLPFALSDGIDAVRRLFWIKETYEVLEHAAAQQQPHLFVHMMAVHPERQGRGLGSELLTSVLDGAQHRSPAAPIVLTTHLEANVVFYRRAGFEVTDERILNPPKSAPYTVWSMARLGRPPC